MLVNWFCFIGDNLVTMSSRVLAGWPDANVAVYPPKLQACYTDDNVQPFMELILSDLFGSRRHADMYVKVDGRLRVFAETMLTTLLMHHSDVQANYPDNAVGI